MKFCSVNVSICMCRKLRTPGLSPLCLELPMGATTPLSFLEMLLHPSLELPSFSSCWFPLSGALFPGIWVCHSPLFSWQESCALSFSPLVAFKFQSLRVYFPCSFCWWQGESRFWPQFSGQGNGGDGWGRKFFHCEWCLKIFIFIRMNFVLKTTSCSLSP